MTPAPEDLGAVARAIVDANSYLTLATADASGRPWATPVWFAPVGYDAFLWVSAIDTDHSRNLAVRPEVGLVIFDSGAAIGTGQAVYVAATAERLDGAALTEGIERFSRHSLASGGRAFSLDEVTEGAAMGLYRATASGHWILDKAEDPAGGRAGDHRIAVRP